MQTVSNKTYIDWERVAREAIASRAAKGEICGKRVNTNAKGERK